MRVRLSKFVTGLFYCLIPVTLAFSPLTHALVTSSITPDDAVPIQVEQHAHHGDSMAAITVIGNSLDSEALPIHCNPFGESSACTLLCSVCLSALPQPPDALRDAPRDYEWLQHYADFNPLVDADPPLRPPRH